MRERLLDNIEEQIAAERTPVLDVRNAGQGDIDDLRRQVAERGWDDSVIWYP